MLQHFYPLKYTTPDSSRHVCNPLSWIKTISPDIEILFSRYMSPPERIFILCVCYWNIFAAYRPRFPGEDIGLRGFNQNIVGYYTLRCQPFAHGETIIKKKNFIHITFVQCTRLRKHFITTWQPEHKANFNLITIYSLLILYCLSLPFLNPSCTTLTLIICFSSLLNFCSCSSHLFDFLLKVLNLRESGQYIMYVYFDFTKSYNRCSQKPLTYKLSHYAIRNNLFSLLRIL